MRSIRTVIIPGTHDCYDRSSIYRSYDLPAMAGAARTTTSVTVLTPERPRSTCAACDVVVHGDGLRARSERLTARSATSGSSSRTTAATWHVGMVHGSLAIPDKTDRDEVVVTKEEIAATGLDYLALGHWHSDPAGQGGQHDLCLFRGAGAGRGQPGRGGQRAPGRRSRTRRPARPSTSRSGGSA